jgi:hypothetical protein
MPPVRDVAFLRPQSIRRSQGCCTRLDTEFSNRNGAYDLGPAPQEETVLGGRPTAGIAGKRLARIRLESGSLCELLPSGVPSQSLNQYNVYEV